MNPADPHAPAAAHPPLLDGMRFLTVAEVAAAVRVSKMAIYRLVHAGELDAVRVGRVVRIPEQAVSRYLARPAARKDTR
jgi:excisionase family DNA binding protein